MKREDFEKLHGPLPGNAVYIDLDEQPQEQVTNGWTDTMIRENSVQKIEALIRQGETAIENMQKALDSEAERVDGLRRVLARKHELE